VYKVENQEILKAHIAMVEYAKDVIGECLNGEGKRKMKEVLREEGEKEKLMMQLMMEQYFRTFDRIQD
jgi:hypothetical protein